MTAVVSVMTLTNDSFAQTLRVWEYESRRLVDGRLVPQQDARDEVVAELLPLLSAPRGRVLRRSIFHGLDDQTRVLILLVRCLDRAVLESIPGRKDAYFGEPRYAESLLSYAGLFIFLTRLVVLENLPGCEEVYSGELRHDELLLKSTQPGLSQS